MTDAGTAPLDTGGLDTGETSSAGGDDTPPDADELPPDWEAVAAGDPRSKGELLAELAEAQARRDEYLDDVRRARADYENLRKRMMREGAGQRDHGRVEVVGALLEALDDFDRTLAAAEGSGDEGLAKGIELVYGKLAAALQAQGLTRIDEVGVGFDPNRHEAVQQVAAEGEGEGPTVREVLRPGYELGGRVIRAAMVAVEQ